MTTPPRPIGPRQRAHWRFVSRYRRPSPGGPSLAKRAPAPGKSSPEYQNEMKERTAMGSEYLDYQEMQKLNERIQFALGQGGFGMMHGPQMMQGGGGVVAERISEAIHTRL